MADGLMVALSLSIKSTMQLSRLAMINSESMGTEEASENDAEVSKHLDSEVNERYEVGDLLVASAGIGALTSGASGVAFPDFFRLNANFGLAPAEVWFA